MEAGPISPTPGSTDPNKSYGKSFALLTTLFFMWGFLTSMNDILAPYVKEVFELSFLQASLVQVAFFAAYFIGGLAYFLISSSSGSDPINRIGYKNGMIFGLLIASFGAFLFYPAAELHSYGFFLAALFIMGLGFTLLQISANPYASIMGSPDTASSRLNLAQGFNSLGTTLAPLIGGSLIFTLFANAAGEMTVDSVKTPYLIFATLLGLLALLIKAAPLPRFTNNEPVETGLGALKKKHLVFGMIAIACYVGAEVSVGTWLISLIELPEIAGLSEKAAAPLVSIYWGGAMIGRFLGAISLSSGNAGRKLSLMVIATIGCLGVMAAAQYLNDNSFDFANASAFLLLVALNFGAFLLGKSKAGTTMGIFGIINCLLLATTALGTGSVALWAVIGVGLFNSIMWSNIFTLAIANLGKYTSQGSSLLVTMVIGGALLPPIQAAFADQFGVQLSYFVPVVCYAYLAWYGFTGHINKESTTPDILDA